MIQFASLLARHKVRAVVIALFLASLVGVSKYAESSSGGITGQTGAGCNCHCNTSNASTGISIQTSATVFEAGQTYTFTVTVSSTAGLQKAGIDISADNGTLTAGNDGLQKVGAELTHSAPKNLNATWTFTYTVPNSGTSDVIRVAANAVNNDGGNGGGNCTDKWNTATYNITIAQRGIALTKSSINFGNRRAGTSSVSDTLSIISNGSAALTVTSSSMVTGTPYSSSPTGTNRTINAGSSEVNTITFNPTTKGTYVDTFVVVSNASSASDQRKTVTVTGTVVQAVFDGVNSMDFGNVNINTTKDLVYTFENKGNDTLFLNPTTPVTLTGSAFSLVGSVSSTTILPNTTANVTVRFSPTAKQTYSGTLSFSALNNITTTSVNIKGDGAAPVLSTSSSIDAGAVKVNTQGAATLTINNTGNAALQITGITLSGPQSAKFSISGSTSFTVAGGGSNAVTIFYLPNSERRDSATITINSNDLVTPVKTVQLFGKGVNPTIKVTPTDTVNFGDVRIGGSATKNTIAIANQSEVPLSITNVTVSGQGYTIESKPAVVQANTTANVTVKFTPTTEAVSVGMVVITSDVPQHQGDTVYLKGRGIKSQIIAPSAINFGSLKVGLTKDSTIKIKNLGTASVAIRSYVLTNPAGAFSILDSSKRSIPANDSITVRLRFSAAAEQNYSGSLTINTEESGGAITISLSGKGIDSKLNIDPTEINFGELDTGKVSEIRTITITNSGTASTTINAIELTGSSMFTLVKQPVLPLVLASKAVDTLEVQFAPMNVGEENAAITITASEGSPLEVLLSGIGKEVPIIISVKPDRYKDLRLSIAPNPARDHVTVMTVSDKQLTLDISIIDLRGNTITEFRKQMISAGIGQFTIPAADLAQGTYLVRVSDGGTVITQEILKIVR